MIKYFLHNRNIKIGYMEEVWDDNNFMNKDNQ